MIFRYDFMDLFTFLQILADLMKLFGQIKFVETLIGICQKTRVFNPLFNC